jgi:hypothetical protein
MLSGASAESPLCTFLRCVLKDRPVKSACTFLFLCSQLQPYMRRMYMYAMRCGCSLLYSAVALPCADAARSC